MKTLTLTIATLAVFLLVNTNLAVDMHPSEPGPVDTATDIGETPVRIAPPEAPPSSESAAPRSNVDGVIRQLRTLQSGTYTSRRTSASIGSRIERIHVIPTEEITAKDLELINEDMNIMCHLLHKELQPRYDSATRYRSSRYGVNYSRSGTGYSTWDLATVLGVESQNTEGIYLEGFGALFLIKVNFPLSAPPETKSDQREPKEAIDSAWEQAKEDLYQSGDPTKKVEPLSPDKYDMYKVSYLKEKLITALKYAANIRKLEPDDIVVVTVKGRRMAEDSASTLTIRTKKSDIDAFSKGESDIGQFRKKVTVLVY